MLFNSVEFIFYFLPVVLGGTYLAAARGRARLAVWWLVAASLFFYAYFKPIYLLLIGVSMLVNYSVGELIMRRNEHVEKKRLLTLGIVFNLGLLAYYKYLDFTIEVADQLLGTHWEPLRIALPLAISFFTFQQIDYQMDCYTGRAHHTTLLEYVLFVAFFPHLLAGPIVRPHQILHQFRNADVFQFQAERFSQGLTWFFLGLAKKLLLADQFAVWANDGFRAVESGQELSLLESWAAVHGYTLQIYFDFSGYSDMAIALACMLGVELPLNFDSPYKSTNIIEFWRRWHITLSKFLRDYLYIPMGGNRKGPARRWANLFATMLLGGLWHGAGWTFIFWGGLHGSYLIVNHAFNALRDRSPLLGRAGGKWSRVPAWIITMIAVMVAWVFFRAADFASACRMVFGMFGQHGVVLPDFLGSYAGALAPWATTAPTLRHLGGGTIMGTTELAAFIVLGWAIALFTKPLHRCTPRQRYVLLIPAFALTLQRVLVSTQSSEFLYFRF